MRTETRVHRIGENMGPIDWTYDFRSHFDCMCSSDARRDEACKDAVAALREIDEAHRAGKEVFVTTYGGWPRVGWNRLANVGMYDGWPYWKPTPSVFTIGPLGGEWHSFRMITGHKIKEPPEER